MTRVAGSAAARALLHALFFASGAAALVYEVLWMRSLSAWLGASLPAATATLASLFLGLAAGSALVGGRAARWRRPLRAFAVVEVGIGACALLVAPALAAAEDHVHGLAARMLVAAAVLAPATLLMGASLPVLGQALVREPRRLGVEGGWLYALNTAGGALGALLVPVVLLPWLGASAAMLATFAVNVGVGVTAAVLDRAGTPPAATAATPTSGADAGRGDPRGRSRLPWGLLVLAGASGAATLCLETVGARVLALVHESSLYSFATVLAVFLVGLAAGAALARPLLARGASPLLVLGAGWAGAGLAIALSPRLFVRLTDGMQYFASGDGLGAHELRVAGLAAAILLPATILAGTALPALMQLAGARGGEPGHALGALLAANLLGCAAGPLVAFAAIPWLGTWWTLGALGAALAACGLALVPARGATRAAACVVAVAILAALAPTGLPRVRVPDGHALVSVREGRMGTVAVIDGDGGRRMKVDNSYTIGGTRAAAEERFQAHLPLLVHGRPRSVAFLGLGTGITAGAALSHDVERVTAVEILPEVVDAARDHFAEANAGVVTDPRVTLVVDDARAWLRRTGGAFDVVVGDLYVPWQRGEATMLTLETFEAARARLAPGGVFAQWIPLYQLGPEEARVLARTFLAAFGRATVWRGGWHPEAPSIVLVASPLPLDVDGIDAAARRLALSGDRSNPYLAHEAGTWLHLVAGIDGTSAWPGLEGPVSSQARPVLELAAARRHVTASSREDAMADLLAALGEPVADAPGTVALDATHASWRAAGGRLWSAAGLAVAGRAEEADAIAHAAMASLPEPLQIAVTGEVLAPVTSP